MYNAGAMKIQDVQNLAFIARLDISEEEQEALLHDLEMTLAYLAQVNAVTIEGSEDMVEDHRNICRDDVVTTETGSYTESILAQVPRREGDYIKVPKIL